MFKNLINGEWVEGAHASRNINPSDTRDLVGEFAQADAAQAREAIAAARAAFAGWSLSTPQQSFDVLDAAAAQRQGLDMRLVQCVHKSPLLAVVHQTHPPRYFFIGDDSADLHFDPRQLPGGWAEHVQWVHFGGISLAREPKRAPAGPHAAGVNQTRTFSSHR